MLRFKQKKNRDQILDLLQATNSVEQHVYYQKDQAPQHIQSYAKPTLGYAARAQGVENIWTKKTTDVTTGIPKVTIGSQDMSAIGPDTDRPPSSRSAASVVTSLQPANILRTIYLPNERASQFKNEVDELNAEIAAQKAQFEQVLL